MSGGSYDYIYSNIEDFASNIRPTTPLRKAFIKHLYKVAEAAHDIEWVDSDDCGPGDEDDAIRAVLGESADKEELSVVVEEARNILKQLQIILDRVNKG